MRIRILNSNGHFLVCDSKCSTFGRSRTANRIGITLIKCIVVILRIRCLYYCNLNITADILNDQFFGLVILYFEQRTITLVISKITIRLQIIRISTLLTNDIEFIFCIVVRCILRFFCYRQLKNRIIRSIFI